MARSRRRVYSHLFGRIDSLLELNTLQGIDEEIERLEVIENYLLRRRLRGKV